MSLERGHTKPILMVVAVCMAFMAGLLFDTVAETSAFARKPQVKASKTDIQIPSSVLALIHLKYEGYVYDQETKKGAPNVNVTLQGSRTYTATTDANGIFRFDKVKPGEYNVTLKGHADYGYHPPTAKLVNRFVQWEVPK